MTQDFSSNFAHLRPLEPDLERLGKLAERYFSDDFAAFFAQLTDETARGSLREVQVGPDARVLEAV